MSARSVRMAAVQLHGVLARPRRHPPAYIPRWLGRDGLDALFLPMTIGWATAHTAAGYAAIAASTVHSTESPGYGSSRARNDQGRLIFGPSGQAERNSGTDSCANGRSRKLGSSRRDWTM